MHFPINCLLCVEKIRISRIYHRFPMQIEKSQPEGKRIMFAEFSALSVDPRVGISRSASESMFDYFSYL